MSTSRRAMVLRRSAALVATAALVVTASGCAGQQTEDVQARLIGDGITSSPGGASAEGPQAALQGTVVREGSCLMVAQSDQGQLGNSRPLVVPVFPQDALDLTGSDPVFTDHDGGSVALVPGRTVTLGGGYIEQGNTDGIALGNGCAERDLFSVHQAG